MTDRITQCDVVNCCEDCPRYADDCDGDKYLDRYPTMHEYAEGKRINPKLSDRVSRADAIEAWDKLSKRGRTEFDQVLMTLPSAEAEPTVIRSKTLLPTKDFKEWAKRIREVNPNLVVIPCDAEVVSAVHGEWIEHKGEWVDFDFYPTKYECSQCHYYVDEGHDSIYCPNCGARMLREDGEA